MSTEADRAQWFVPTNGRVGGVTGLAAAAVVVVAAILDSALEWVAGGLLIGLVVWMVLLRPRVGLRDRTLLLRGVVSTVEIPLSKVTSADVRQVFVAQVKGRRFVNAALGRPLRELRGDGPSRPSPYTDHILALIDSHRADARRWGDGGGDVRRLWALREISALVALALAAVVLALI